MPKRWSIHVSLDDAVEASTIRGGAGGDDDDDDSPYDDEETYENDQDARNAFRELKREVRATARRIRDRKP